MAFAVDGWALEIALKYYRKAFTELAILSRTAICCRATPSQKAQVAPSNFLFVIFVFLFLVLLWLVKFTFYLHTCKYLVILRFSLSVFIIVLSSFFLLPTNEFHCCTNMNIRCTKLLIANELWTTAIKY